MLSFLNSIWSHSEKLTQHFQHPARHICHWLGCWKCWIFSARVITGKFLAQLAGPTMIILRNFPLPLTNRSRIGYCKDNRVNVVVMQHFQCALQPLAVAFSYTLICCSSTDYVHSRCVTTVNLPLCFLHFPCGCNQIMQWFGRSTEQKIGKIFFASFFLLTSFSKQLRFTFDLVCHQEFWNVKVGQSANFCLFVWIMFWVLGVMFIILVMFCVVFVDIVLFPFLAFLSVCLHTFFSDRGTNLLKVRVLVTLEDTRIFFTDILICWVIAFMNFGKVDSYAIVLWKVLFNCVPSFRAG